MKISKIQIQKKNKQRYSIFIDDQFAFGIDEAILIKFAIRKGLEIDRTFIEKVLEAEFHYQFYQKALNYLSYGLKSEQEVRNYLAKAVRESQNKQEEETRNFAIELESQASKVIMSSSNNHDNPFDYASYDVSQSLIEQIIDQLKKQNLINDLIYGQAYVRTQANINRKGPKNIAYELRKKGLNDLQIEDALTEYSEDLQAENLESLADKFIKSKKRLSLAMQRTKLYQHLNQKGYDRTMIQSFLDNYQIEVNPEVQQELLDKEGQKFFRKRSKKYEGYELKQRLIVDLRQKGFDYQAIQNWLDDNESILKKKGESE